MKYWLLHQKLNAHSTPAAANKGRGSEYYHKIDEYLPHVVLQPRHPSCCKSANPACMSAKKIHASSEGMASYLFGTFQVLQKHFMCSNNITEFIKASFQ